MKKTISFLSALSIALVVNAENGKMKLHGSFPSAPDGEKIYLASGYTNIDSAIVTNGKFSFLLNNVQPDEYLLTRKNKKGQPEYVMLYLDYCNTHVELEKDTFILYNSPFIKSAVSGNATHTTVSEINNLFMRSTNVDPQNQPQVKARLKAIAMKADLASAFVMWKYAQTYSTIMSREEITDILNKMSAAVKATPVGKRFKEVYENIASPAPGRIMPHL